MKDYVNELNEAQKALHEEIQRIADFEGLATDMLCPIFDGVADIEAYLGSSPKIMWILKEPYDDFDDNGNPCGGGWIMYKDGFNHPDAWKQKSYQGMTYILYGFRNNCYWGDGNLPAIKQYKSMLNELNSIAYINISKMPGQLITTRQAGESYYSTWRNILHKQIKIYNPDVIIFGGSMTFFDKDIDKERLNHMEHIGTRNTFCDVYEYNGRWLLSIKHPARFSEVYVDGAIDGLKFIEEHRK